MNIKSILVVVGMVIGGMQAQEALDFIPLSIQAQSIYEKDKANHEKHQCHACDFALPYFQTIEDFEKAVYARYISLSTAGWDYHDVFIRFRGWFYSFLTFLHYHWDDLKDREEIIFNTPAFEWENIRDFYTTDYDEYCKNFRKIIEKIATHYNNMPSEMK